MCKLFILTKTSGLNNIQITKLLNAIHAPLTKTEDQGFGWAMYGTKGLHGEKYVNPDDFKTSAQSFGPVESLVAAQSISEKFGKTGAPVGALIAHGRTSTNDVSLLNTHPIINDQWALIHNGVVQNIGAEIVRKTTNDTEFVLEHYTQGGIAQVAESLAGYYACGAINKTNGNLAVFRDSTAQLHVAWIEQLGAYAFATTKEILQVALKSLGFKKCPIKDAAFNFHIVFNKQGEMIASDQFTPKGRSFGALDEKSLGYSIASDGLDDQVPTYREKYDWQAEYETYKHQSGEIITEEEYDSLKFDDQLEYEGFSKRYRYGA